MIWLTAIWCIAVFIQLIYWIPVILHRDRHTLNQKSDPEGVSVVICVHRPTRELTRLLQTLLHQTYSLYEVIVVNDGPDAEVTKVLEPLTHHRNLRVIEFDASQKATPGKKAPLAAGIKAAQHAWILLTDGDCLVTKEWIATMMAHTQHAEIVFGYAPHTGRRSMFNTLQRFENLMIALQYFSAALRSTAYMGVGRNLLYRKSLFNAVNGFQSHAHVASGDDDLFVQSVGKKNTGICLHADAFATSDAPASWAAWLHQKRRHLSAASHYTRTAQIQTTLFASSFLLLCGLIPIFLIVSIEHIIGVFMIGGIFWLFFGLLAFRLKQRGLTVWFPLLAPAYCLVLCTFAVLMTLPVPDKWSRF